MKVKKIDERFNTETDRKSHFYKHVTREGKSNDPKYPDKLTFTYEQFPNSIEYEKGADRFARTPLSSNVLGYVRIDGRYTKYNKETKEFIVYTIENGEPVDITYFPCERSYWENQKKDKQEKSAYLHKINPDEDVK